MKFTAEQRIIPIIVGISIAAKVHFKLPVSFFTVSTVVAQGQWKSEKIITQRAVDTVQPFEMSSC